MAASEMAKFSEQMSAATAQAGASVVTVQARRRIPSSGTYWREGIIVTVDHAIQYEERITVLLAGGKGIEAKLAGRDAATDLAILKTEVSDGSVPQIGDPTQLKLGNLILALGRTRQGNLVASSGIIGGLAGESRTWRGGRLDQSIRLDLQLYPGFSGGPLVNVEGKILGINTSGLGGGRPMTVPTTTVNRTVDELLAKGYIPRPYLGAALQPVRIPESVRTSLESSALGGLIVLHVETGGPAEKAGIVLGDVIVELEGRPVPHTYEIRSALASSKVGDTLKLKLLRGGTPVDLSVDLAERPAR
jgi:S1-C subfamily serine protease